MSVQSLTLSHAHTVTLPRTKLKNTLWHSCLCLILFVLVTTSVVRKINLYFYLDKQYKELEFRFHLSSNINSNEASCLVHKQYPYYPVCITKLDIGSIAAQTKCQSCHQFKLMHTRKLKTVYDS